MKPAPAATAEASRQLMLAALSAGGAAMTGMAEALREPDTLEAARREGEASPLAFTSDTVPLEEEVFAPLVDALRLACMAVGNPVQLHRIVLALDRFTDGDD